MDGIFNINKPEGKTSFSIVAFVKRLSQERRAGHAGTLDPLATGVLPVCLGKATRMVQYIMGSPKIYRADVELGISTDTFDITGKVISTGDPSGVNLKQIEAALVPFRGLIQQVPPVYSAIKHNGKPLYRLARAGIQVEPGLRTANIYRLEMTAWQPPVVTLEIECGKGTYIRSIAHDLGKSLGCGATLKSLVRLKYGCFELENSITMCQLEEAFRQGYWRRFIYPMDEVLQDRAAMILSDDKAENISKGSSLDFAKAEAYAQCCRAYSIDGRFLGVLSSTGNGQWHPQKIFARS